MMQSSRFISLPQKALILCFHINWWPKIQPTFITSGCRHCTYGPQKLMHGSIIRPMAKSRALECHERNNQMMTALICGCWFEIRSTNFKKMLRGLPHTYQSSVVKMSLRRFNQTITVNVSDVFN